MSGPYYSLGRHAEEIAVDIDTTFLLFGIDRFTPLVEAKRRARKLRSIFHPDRAVDESVRWYNTEMMKVINCGYDRIVSYINNRDLAA